jgi:hypothetical protein
MRNNPFQRGPEALFMALRCVLSKGLNGKKRCVLLIAGGPVVRLHQRLRLEATGAQSISTVAAATAGSRSRSLLCPSFTVAELSGQLPVGCMTLSSVGRVQRRCCQLQTGVSKAVRAAQCRLGRVPRSAMSQGMCDLRRPSRFHDDSAPFSVYLCARLPHIPLAGSSAARVLLPCSRLGRQASAQKLLLQFTCHPEQLYTGRRQAGTSRSRVALAPLLPPRDLNMRHHTSSHDAAHGCAAQRVQ